MFNFNFFSTLLYIYVGVGNEACGDGLSDNKTHYTRVQSYIFILKSDYKQSGDWMRWRGYWMKCGDFCLSMVFGGLFMGKYRVNIVFGCLGYESQSSDLYVRRSCFGSCRVRVFLLPSKSVSFCFATLI